MLCYIIMLYYKMKGNKTCKSKSSSFEVILSRLSYVLQVIMGNRPCHVLPRQLSIDIDVDIDNLGLVNRPRKLFYHRQVI